MSLSSAATSTSSSSVCVRMTPVWRKSASIAASEPASAAVCELAAFMPARVVPPFTRARASRARRAARCVRTRGGCRTTRGRAGRASCCRPPPTTRAGRSTRRPPCSRSIRRTRSPSSRSWPRSSSGEAERAALRREADLPRRERARREGRVQPRRRRRHAEAVRPDHARSVLAHEREQLLLSEHALGSDLGEAGGDDESASHSGLERILRGRNEHVLARQADDREVDVLGDLGDARIPAHARRRDRRRG